MNNENEILINKLTEREKFCLLAYMVTKDAPLAYLCSREKVLTAKKSSLATQTSRWLNSDPVQAWIADYNETHRMRQVIAGSNTENVSREELLKELSISFRDPKLDAKTKADIGLKLASLEDWKSDTSKQGEDSQVKYYLPLKCSQCNLYKEAKNKLDTNKKQ